MLRCAEISSVEGVRLGSFMKKRDSEEEGRVEEEVVVVVVGVGGTAMKVRSGMK